MDVPTLLRIVAWHPTALRALSSGEGEGGGEASVAKSRLVGRIRLADAFQSESADGAEGGNGNGDGSLPSGERQITVLCADRWTDWYGPRTRPEPINTHAHPSSCLLLRRPTTRGYGGGAASGGLRAGGDYCEC